MKKTSLPRTPVCQPMTLIVRPSPEPTYQPIRAESMSTSPESPGEPLAEGPEPQSGWLLRRAGSGRRDGVICLHGVKYGSHVGH